MPKYGNRQKSQRDIARLARDVQFIVFDFDGVFTDNRVLVFDNGTEAVFCSRADGLGLVALRKAGVKLLVLSKEPNPVVRVRCRKLKIPCIQGCDEKGSVLKREAKKAGTPLKHVAYLGNDINDLECLQIVGFPACVADAHPDVLENSLYVTKKKGGYGAVREFCDFIAEQKTT